jgi:hypothetical protein
MNTQGYTLGEKAMAQVSRTVREVARRLRNTEPHRARYTGQQLRRQAILQSDLLAAVDTLTDPSTAQATILQGNGSGDLELSDIVVTVVNRFENISIDADSYIKIEWIDGEWQPYAADCGPQSESFSFGSASGGPSASAGTGGP